MPRTCLLVAICVIGGAVVASEQPVQSRRVKVKFVIAETSPANGLTEHVIPNIGNAPPTKIYLPKAAALDTDDIATARVGIDDMNSPTLELSFTDEGAKKLSTITGRNIGKRLVILVDDVVIGAPIVRSPMSSSIMLSGRFEREECERIVQSLNFNTGSPRMDLIQWSGLLGCVLLVCCIVVCFWRWQRLEKTIPRNDQ